MVVNINALVSTLAITRTARLVLAAIIGLWIGLQVSLATAGAFTRAVEFPLIGLMVAAPLLVAAMTAALSPSVRSALLGLPQPLLVGLHVPRILGIFFLLLAADGRLGGPFPQSAGWGDIVTGALALPLAFVASRRPAPNSVFWWSVFGAADLIIAAALGLLSANGSELQLINAGAGSEAIAYLPWTLIPTVLVPFYLITHGIIFAQLRAGRVSAVAFAPT